MCKSLQLSCKCEFKSLGTDPRRWEGRCSLVQWEAAGMGGSEQVNKCGIIGCGSPSVTFIAVNWKLLADRLVRLFCFCYWLSTKLHSCVELWTVVNWVGVFFISCWCISFLKFILVVFLAKILTPPLPAPDYTWSLSIETYFFFNILLTVHLNIFIY